MECQAQKPCARSFTVSAVLSERLARVGSCSFQMSWKDVSCQSPSRPRWSLCKSCSSNVLYAKGSLALAPAQPLNSWVTSIKLGSPLGEASASSSIKCKGWADDPLWRRCAGSFIPHGFVEHLLCARHNSVTRSSVTSKTRQWSLPHGA